MWRVAEWSPEVVLVARKSHLPLDECSGQLREIITHGACLARLVHFQANDQGKNFFCPFSTRLSQPLPPPPYSSPSLFFCSSEEETFWKQHVLLDTTTGCLFMFRDKRNLHDLTKELTVFSNKILSLLDFWVCKFQISLDADGSKQISPIPLPSLSAKSNTSACSISCCGCCAILF